MGTMPLIYDRPQIAPIINAIVDKSEYAWIGPFEYEDLLYMHAQLPSKYHVLLYGVGVSDIIRDEMMRDFNQNKPVVIYFDKDFSYFGSKIANYARPFIDFLNENYTTINLYKEENVKYQSLAPIHDADKVNIKTKLYIRKDRAEQIVSKLLAKNYIQKAQ